MYPPIISVITVVRNAATELDKTVRSVTGQDYPALEYIVVDGGSTDGTVEVIRNNAKRIDCLFSEPDLGPYDAMNKGLARATGDWVIFMNAGDLFADKDTVSKVMTYNLQGFGVVYGDVIAQYSQAQVLKVAGEPEEMWKGMVFCHQSAFVLTELAREKGFDLQYPVGADFDMFFRLFCAGYRFKHVPFPVAVIEVQGISNQKMLQSAREHFSIVRIYRKLSSAERLYHHGFIVRVALVTLGYAILPVKLMHRMSTFITKHGQQNRQTDNL